MSAGLYECEVSHVRTTPIRNRFRYRTYLWLVDLDDLPRLPRPLGVLARFRSEDHLSDDHFGDDRPGNDRRGTADRSIREKLDAYLAGEGIDLAGGRVLLLTAARVLGHVFNPLSVYWCHDGRDPAGALVCVVAEVHNTYGGRHCYLLRTDERGRAEVEKDFYVSPFEPATGARYRMSLPEPGEHLALTVTRHRPGAAPFVAGVTGRRRPATTGTLLRLAARHPMAPLAVAVRIRAQGVGLFLRGLPVVPRPGTRPRTPPRSSPRTRPGTRSGEQEAVQ